MRTSLRNFLILFLFVSRISAKELPTTEDPFPERGNLYSHFLNALLSERQGEFSRALTEYNKTLELNPSATLVYQLRATLHLKMGKPEKALSDAQSYVKAHPEDVSGLLLLAQLYLLLGQRTAAQLILEKILELEPDHREALFTLAALSMTSDFARSAELYERLLKIEPQNIEAAYHLGILYQKLDQKEKAKEMFKKVIELDSQSLPSLIVLGQIYEAEDKLESALQYFESALNQMPDNFPLRLKLILLYAKSMNLEKIEELLQPYKYDPNAPQEANLWLGILYEAKKEWQKALRYYVKARQQLDSSEINIRLASIYSQMGQLKKALKIIRHLVRQFPDDPQLRYFLGLAYLDVKDPRKALREFQVATDLKKDFVSAYFQTGVALDSLQRWQEAEKNFHYVIELDSQNAAAYNYLGYTYADRNEKDKFFEARKLLEKALLLDPDNAAYLDSIGWLEYREGNYAEALNFLKIAAEKMPDPIILEHLGDCQLALHQYADSAESYSKALELESENKTIRKKLKKLYQRVIPGSPAREALKKFEWNLATQNISGLLILKGKGAVTSLIPSDSIQGFFYLKNYEFKSTSSFYQTSQLRVDLGMMPFSPPLTLILQKDPQYSWQVFPPEYKDQLEEKAEPLLGLVLYFLNGGKLREFDDPQTVVREKSRVFLLSKENETLILDKKTGLVYELANDDFRIHVEKYQRIGNLHFPQKITILPLSSEKLRKVGARFQIEFSHLSLDKIDHKLFKIGKEVVK